MNPAEKELDTQEASSAQVVSNKKKDIPLIIGGTILTIVVALSVALYFLNTSIATDIASKKASIAGYQSQIITLSSDRAVMSQELLGRNREAINRVIEQSMAQKILERLANLKRDYSVNFNGFAYSDGKFTTQVSVPTDLTNKDPSARLARFIGDFRTGSGTALGTAMDLAPISSISGDQNTRGFSAEFRLR